MKWIVAALAAVVISGPAEAGLFGPSEKDLAALHRVGVVSLLGPTFHSVQVGITVIQNKTHDLPVPQWEIDAFALSDALELLAQKGRFQAEALALDGLEEPTLYGKADDYAISSTGVATLVASARRHGFDGVLVVRRNLWDQMPFYTPGYGVLRRTIFGQSAGCVYASMGFDLYRVDTGKAVTRRAAPPCTQNNLTFEPRATLEAYSDAEQVALEAAVKAQVHEGIEGALTAMKLLTGSVVQH